MTTCDFCGGEAIGANVYICSYCGNTHCQDHRVPENHKCVYLAFAKPPDSRTNITYTGSRAIMRGEFPSEFSVRPRSHRNRYRGAADSDADYEVGDSTTSESEQGSSEIPVSKGSSPKPIDPSNVARVGKRGRRSFGQPSPDVNPDGSIAQSPRRSTADRMIDEARTKRQAWRQRLRRTTNRWMARLKWLAVLTGRILLMVLATYGAVRLLVELLPAIR